MIWRTTLTGLVWLGFTFRACVLAGQGDLDAQVPAPEHSSSDREGLFGFLMAGVQSERQRLTAGVFRAHGMKSLEHPKYGRLEGRIHIFCAVDHNNNRLRFDRTEPVRTPAPSREALAEWRETEQRTIRFCRTPESSAYYRVRASRLDVRRSDYEFPILERTTFDVRCLGMYDWTSFVGGDDFDTVFSGMVEHPPDEVVDEGKGLYRVCWTYGGALRRTLWIDETQGFSPVRFVVEDKGTPEGPDWAEEPVITNDATWQQISGVWVPKTFALYRRRVVREGKIGERKTIGEDIGRYDLHFDWESVNQPVSEKYFHYDDFDAEKGTWITDWRSGEPVVTQIVGERVPGLDLESTPPPKRMTAARFLMIGGYVLLAGSVLLYWWLRHRRKAVAGTRRAKDAVQQS